MAAPYNPPIKNQDFVFRVSLSSMATAGTFQVNPTIAAGDFKVDKDGAGLVNLSVLPTVQPAGSCLVKITLSAAEMNADVVTIVGVDAVTKEWADFVVSIPTVLPGELGTPLILAADGLTNRTLVMEHTDAFGGMILAQNTTAATPPFMVIGGEEPDTGTGTRSVFIGGGPFNETDANAINFYTDPTTGAGLGQGVLRLAIPATGIADFQLAPTVAGVSVLARSSHTGTQAAATVTGLATIATSGSATDLTTGTLAVARIADASLTFTKLQVLNTATLLGNNTGSNASPVQLNVAAVKTMLAYTYTDLGAMPLTSLATQAATTFVANSTAGAAAPTAVTVATAKTMLAYAAVASSGSASDLTTGTLPDARLAGAYTAVTSLAMGGALTGVTTLDMNTILTFVSNGFIQRGTTDGADTGQVAISGGGSNTAARGAYIMLYGNENVSQPGDLRLYSGTGGTIDINGTPIAAVATSASATDLTVGTLPDARLNGSYTSVVNMTLSGALTVNGGKVAFPAAQVASAGANDLDDYEEGTFTPTLTAATPATGVTYTTQTGKYTKVGRLVFMDMTISTSSNGTGGVGLMRIGGFPFTVTGGWIGSPLRFTGITLTANYHSAFTFASGTGTIGTLQMSGNAASNADLNWANMGASSSVITSIAVSV